MSIAIKPEGESVLRFLEREATAIAPGDLPELAWGEIDPSMMPVCYTKTPVAEFAYVLQNKDQFYAYKRVNNDGNERSFYIIKIEKLWAVSDLAQNKHSIAKDRIYEKVRAKKKVTDPQHQEALMTAIATTLNRVDGTGRTCSEIARNFDVTSGTVVHFANKLRNLGVPIPAAIKGVQYSVFVANLKKNSPQLFGLPKKEDAQLVAARTNGDKPVKRKPGRPKKATY